MARWLRAYPAATRSAQDVRPCDGNGYKELFKYVYKVTSHSDGHPGALMPLEALDTIFQALDGRRIFQPMGFSLPDDSGLDEEASVVDDCHTYAASRIGHRTEYVWRQELADWKDVRSPAVLSGFAPHSQQSSTILRAPRLVRMRFVATNRYGTAPTQAPVGLLGTSDTPRPTSRQPLSPQATLLRRSAPTG